MEKNKNCQDLEFCKKLVVDYYFEKVQKLNFSVYDIDNKSFELSDDDYLGGIECTVGQGQCADHDCGGSHDLIGTLETTLAKMQTAGAGFSGTNCFLHLGLELKFFLAGRDPRNSGFLPPDSASDPTLKANKPLSYYKPCGKVCSTLTATRNCCIQRILEVHNEND